MNLLLTRFCYSPLGTFGRFSTPDGITLYTVERPWLDNQPEVSCIPEGPYDCIPRQFYGGDYPAIEITHVPGRSHILFHIANVPGDVAGCIGVGSRLGVVKNTWGILDSKSAFQLFMSHFGKGFKLTITHYLVSTVSP